VSDALGHEYFSQEQICKTDRADKTVSAGDLKTWSDGRPQFGENSI